MLTWREYLINSQNEMSSKKKLVEYAYTIEQRGFPVIFDRYHLSYLLNMSPVILSKIINSANSFYREFTIPKKNGGQRRIKSPYPSLRMCQKWIKTHIIEKIPIAEQCYSYVKGKSIVDNATVHIGSTVLYKLDLENFFDSIPLKRIMSIFLNCGYSHKVSYYLSKICTLDDCLPQGACTSPPLSNIVCKRLDRRLAGFADYEGIAYTRYSDDLFFSGVDISNQSKAFIKKIVTAESFQINNEKELYIDSPRQRKIITGLLTTEKEVKLPRSYKRELKASIFKFLKYNEGLDIYKPTFDPLCTEKIIGKLLFWKYVEKNQAYIDDIIFHIKNHEKSYIESITPLS